MADVGLPTKMLGAHEYQVLHTRTHAKVLTLPALTLIGIGALVGAGTAIVPTAYRPAGQVVVLVMGAALAGWACVRPFLRWRATTYSLTSRRLVMRTGVLNKVSVDLPLWRVNDVSTQRSLGDRLLGCGTLVVKTVGEGSVVLDDVPDVEHVQRAVAEQLFGPPGEHSQAAGDEW